MLLSYNYVTNINYEVLSMDRKVFNDMSIIDQVEYINNKLKEYESFNKLCKGENLPKSTISERFKKYGYIFVDGAYRLRQTREEAHTISSNTNVHNSITSPVEANTGDIIGMIKMLQGELDTLKEEVANLKSAPVKSKIKDIDLTTFTGTTENRSFRVDSNVLKEFNSFCKKNKKYKKQDLLSQALKEFIDKYK